MQINSHGMLGYAAMNSATLRDAIALMEQYLQIRTLLVRVRHDTVDGVVQLRFEEAIPLQLPLVRRSVLETIVLTIKNLFDHITAGAARTTYASFPFAEPMPRWRARCSTARCATTAVVRLCLPGRGARHPAQHGRSGHAAPGHAGVPARAG
jgi:hypothetical protein